jgi:signal transduction histidine kinase
VTLHRLLPLLALGLNLVLLGSALAPDRRSARNRIFACFVAAMAVWNLGVLGLRSTGSPETAVLWEQFLHIGVIAIPVLFYHYVIVFLDAPRDRILRAGYVSCALFWLVSVTPAFLQGVTPTVWGFMPVAGPLYAVFFVYFNAYLIIGLHRLLRARRSMISSFMRNRTLLVVAGVTVSLAGGVIDLARFIFGWDWLYPPGIPTNAVFALALGVAILRYRLMDARLLAKRSLVYALTAVLVLPAMVVALVLLHRLAPAGAGASGDGAVRDGLVLGVAFLLALPVLNRVSDALDRLMFRRRHGVRDALVALGNELPRLLHTQTLADTLTTALMTEIPAAHVSLQVVQETSDDLAVLSHATSEAAPGTGPPRVAPDLAAWLALSARALAVDEAVFHGDAVSSIKHAIADLERQRVALLLPLIMEGRLAAVLTVGEKLSGEIYEADEIQLLEALLQAAAVALKNAGLYADLQRQMQELRRTQDQLMQAAKLAAIGELAAGIAHEVNNPLMVIIGTATVLRRRPELSAIHDRLDTIETQGARATKLVRGLLDFARRRARTAMDIPIREPIERALALVADRLRKPALETIKLFDESDPMVFGDRDELTQVFINLISNAADAMPRGGRLTLSTEVRRHEDVAYLSVRVADTGVGIPPENRDKIFESFFTTKAEGQGTGLGLAVTLEIVKTHEGTIEVESAVGKGTTMIVNLPLAGQAREASGEQRDASTASGS